MRSLSVLLSISLAAMLLVATPARFGASASAALPTCTATQAKLVAGGHIRLPVRPGPNQYDCKLQLGDTTPGVLALERSLERCNRAHQVVVDNHYGSVTRDVIAYIQGVWRIDVDGVYGPQTRTVLRWTIYNGFPAEPVGCLPPQV